MYELTKNSKCSRERVIKSLALLGEKSLGTACSPIEMGMTFGILTPIDNFWPENPGRKWLASVDKLQPTEQCLA